MMETILSAAGESSAMEIVAVVLAIAYLILVIRQNILCWPAALLSTGLYMVIFADAKLYMEAALQVFYGAMAVYGWHRWRAGEAGGSPLPIRTWGLRQHGLALVAIVGLTVVAGAALRFTSAALPFADSFTTVAALVATYMVAQKLLENWYYWFVIDSVSIYLYVNRGLWLTVLLFVIYLLLILVGYRRWRGDHQSQQRTALAAAG